MEIPKVMHVLCMATYSGAENVAITLINSLKGKVHCVYVSPACGTPVCGMNTRGICEYVVNGKTGYLFENTVESCAAALQRAFENEGIMKNQCIYMAQKYRCQEANRMMDKLYCIKR